MKLEVYSSSKPLARLMALRTQVLVKELHLCWHIKQIKDGLHLITLNFKEPKTVKEDCFIKGIVNSIKGDVA